MLSTLHLLRYNNYYNRRVKREDTLEAYGAYRLGDPIEGVNFIPNDWVDTIQVVNWDAGNPDYLLVVDEDGNLQSRWFVISTSRVTAGQLELQLHRDTVADFYNETMSTDMFVEKGYPTSQDDPAIFNSEDMTFNQIKTNEVLLTDKSGIPWIVGYVPRDSEIDKTVGNKITTNYFINSQGIQDVASIEAYCNSIPNYSYAQYQDGSWVNGDIAASSIRYGVDYYQKVGTNSWYNFKAFCNSNGVYDPTIGYTLNNSGSSYSGSKNLELVDGTWKSSQISGNTGSVTANYPFPFDDFPTNIPTYTSSPRPANSGIGEDALNFLTRIFNATHKEDAFYAQDQQIIRAVDTGLYYKVTKEVNENLSSEQGQTVKSSGLWADSDLLNKLYGTVVTGNGKSSKFRMNLGGANISASPNTDYVPGTLNHVVVNNGQVNNTFTIYGRQYQYRLRIEPLSEVLECTWLDSDSRTRCVDSPYDMFCIPYPTNGKNYAIKAGTTTLVTNPEPAAGFAIATQLMALIGSDNVYDVQLLPYCPLPTAWIHEDYIDISEVTHSQIINTTTSQNINAIIWCPHSEFTRNITFNIPVADTVVDKKIQNETEVWRLCSPNYSGLFEFSPAMNNGVATFNVDCNYKPFSPYIHINPDFGGLYGSDFNDSRGLVCGGDFSLPQVTSAWTDYQVQNKNYQQIFARQKENLEINNAVQREKEAWQIAANTTSAFTDAFTAGNSIYGSLMQSGFSLVAGMRDRQLNDILRNEAINYSIDQFGYQLGNIQALPQGLAKVSAFTANNKLFPFLEKYECTQVERNALRQKLRFNGYTIMRIGQPSQFINNPDGETYLKGQMIRFPDSLSEDYHVANALASELYKGVFI